MRRQGSSSRSLACFWQKCFILLMIGTNGKVHLLSMICIVSFLKFYIPLNLCHLFVAMCLYRDHVITSETLIKSFRQFLATKDREALEKCLSDDFNPNDEDVLDLLTSLKWFKAPSKNIEAIIINLPIRNLSRSQEMESTAGVQFSWYYALKKTFSPSRNSTSFTKVSS